METRLSEELITISTRLMLANDKCEIIRIATDINNAVEKLLAYEKSGTKALAPQKKSVSGILKFTNEEIQNSQMAKTFKKEFIANGLCAHVIKRESGKNSFCYEIRYRSNGYKIEVSSTDLATAKKKFLEKTKPSEIDKYRTGKVFSSNWKNFEEFALFYFEKYRKRKVTELTYKFDLMRLQRNILPILGKTAIHKITPTDCQEIIDRLANEGKSKTANEVYSLLSVIFKSAIAHNLITKNPISTVIKAEYSRQHGTALTREEETTLLNALNGSKFALPTALVLFCGLRPNELNYAEKSGLFIKTINSKRKTKKVEYKKIPIIDKLKPYLPENGIFVIPNVDSLRERIKIALPNHKLYDLRTTFYTRCDELGVSAPARDHFVGHSNGALTDTYRDLSDDYLLKEGMKLNKW